MCDCLLRPYKHSDECKAATNRAAHFLLHRPIWMAQMAARGENLGPLDCDQCEAWVNSIKKAKQ